MKYIIFAERDGEEDMLCRAVAPDEEAYLRQDVIPVLEPLSDEEYIHGPAALLHTLARFSYVLDGDALYWCVEWRPGLIVIRFEPDQPMQYASMRSTDGTFTGTRTMEEINAAGDRTDDPQYNLVFESWDTQFNEELRAKWPLASDLIRDRYNAALHSVQSMAIEMSKRFGEEQAYQAWLEQCRNGDLLKGRVQHG